MEKRVVIYYKLRGKEEGLNLPADEFHEDGEYIKAYKGNELIAVVRSDMVEAAYITQKKDPQGF